MVDAVAVFKKMNRASGGAVATVPATESCFFPSKILLASWLLISQRMLVSVTFIQDLPVPAAIGGELSSEEFGLKLPCQHPLGQLPPAEPLPALVAPWNFTQEVKVFSAS